MIPALVRLLFPVDFTGSNHTVQPDLVSKSGKNWGRFGVRPEGLVEYIEATRRVKKRGCQAEGLACARALNPEEVCELWPRKELGVLEMEHKVD